MKFDNSAVRRRDRLMDEKRALELLKTSEYGVLSLCGADGRPYGIPVNFVWDGKTSVYIHCAPEGRKLRLLQENPKASFCIVGRVNILPRNFTTEYESVVLEGTARIGLTDEEKTAALHLLVDKLSPEFKAVGYKYTQASFHRVEVIRMDISTFSAKRKKVPKPD